MFHFKSIVSSKLIIFSLVLTTGFSLLKAQPANKIIIDDDIRLLNIGDSVYIHETMHSFGNTAPFASNGMILIRNGEALMIDTPMDIDKTSRLYRYVSDSLGAEVKILIIGHFHADCLGGLPFLQEKGVKSVANILTLEKCRELSLPVPLSGFQDSLNFNFHDERIECRYFGGGHSFDNITVWFPSRNILFGGCLVRSLGTTGLGNLSDAVVSDWETTVEKVWKTYYGAKIVVPGHGDFGGTELLKHTIDLARIEKSRL